MKLSNDVFRFAADGKRIWFLNSGRRLTVEGDG
jgi:hypothetical protein